MSRPRPFIIICRGRTGSSLLRDLLDAHPGIVAQAELFASRSDPRWQPQHFEPTPDLIELLRHQPIEFLERYAFAATDSARAVGFKMIYHHAHDDGWQAVWPHLASMDDLIVLHNRRRNMLRTLVSWRRALASGVWKATSSPAAERPCDLAAVADAAPRIELTADECRRFFVATREREQEFEAFFDRQQRLEIEYEDLVEDRDGVMARVQGTLGVEPRRLRTQLHKPARPSLEQEIVDYPKLKRVFKGSEWAHFFQQ